MEARYHVLILEDYVPVTKTITTAIEAAGLPCQLFTAKSIAEGQQFLAELNFDLIVADINLPDGNGIDFLCDAAMTHPNARAIVMTATPTDDFRLQAEDLGVIRFLEKPLDAQKLVRLVAQSLGSVRSGHAPTYLMSGKDTFHATIGQLTPLDIIEMKCSCGTTVTLRFNNQGKSGKIFINEGEIVHAETGHLIGRGAFYEIMSWKCGTVDRVTLSSTQQPRHTIVSDWRTLVTDVRANLATATAA